MSPERTLAFLQNFYTDVTLYVPAEAGAPPAVGSSPAVQAAEAAESATPAVAAAPARPAPAPVTASLPPPPGPTAPKLPSLASRPTPPPAPTAPMPAAASLPPPAPAASAAPVAPVPAPGAAPVAAVPPVMLTTFSTLSDNAQGVVLLFRLPAEQFKKLPRNVFLNKLLQALGLVMADVVLVNVESHLPVALSNLRREIAAGRVLAFGRNLLDVAVRTTQIYEPVQFASLNLSYLAAAEVELLEYDTSLKKRLWAGLQRMFL